VGQKTLVHILIENKEEEPKLFTKIT